MCIVLGNPGAIVVADVDECQDSDLCHTNSTCLNTPGSYMCSCKDGYSGNGSFCDGI